jgi:hypothetical protein
LISEFPLSLVISDIVLDFPIVILQSHNDGPTISLCVTTLMLFFNITDYTAWADGGFGGLFWTFIGTVTCYATIVASLAEMESM